MQNRLNVLMAQINPTVGAITENTNKIIDCIHKNQKEHDLIVFPELALTGYPPEDLLLRGELFQRIEEALKRIQNHTKACFVIVGHPSKEHDLCYNSATIFHNQTQLKRYHKQTLPNYGVFDEKRYFSAGKPDVCIFNVKNYHIALCICEDLWSEGPIERNIKEGCDILLCINASPFDYEKYDRRKKLVQKYAQKGPIIIYVNQVGGQDELVFDGQSFAMNPNGEITALAPAFKETYSTVTIEGQNVNGAISPLLPEEALIYEALVCGLKDYIHKNHFPGVILGLSGGIDSALTLAIAVDSLGKERVHAVMMPSRFTASMSSEDALKQLNDMGVSYTTLPIENTFKVILETLAPSFQGLKKDTTEENIQARIRGLFLMALSNKTGNMVLTTSNKSETAVGYSTIYGDMVGGLAVLKDVYKTQIYKLARYRNKQSHVIPERVLVRPPSAELSENQTDQDTLPEYDILDAIVTLYMEQNKSAEDIITKGYPSEVVYRIIKMIKQNEYKRRQSAPGIKITPRSFDRDWRYPITNHF
ncbi:NAD+ synthase [Legionella impletisoli]|uniref:Glutamine-dependent NAD(+) synthetase n=1 Tax=Legionella impletisoli TaxID=343510 RepID=A0A917JPS9_9GAMM|nr:NAD+ synthase [Legionella impletisoli]GGI80898.1 NAD+ synthase [Legionella impletisoli]